MIMIVFLCGFTNLIVRIVLKVVVVQMLVSDINNLECQDMMMIIILMMTMMVIISTMMMMVIILIDIDYEEFGKHGQFFTFLLS